MRTTRRRLLELGLGASALGLLDRFGFVRDRARADASGRPTRFVTLHVPGGWVPQSLVCPLSAAEVARVIPDVGNASGEPVHFTASQVTNLDGSGDAPSELGGLRFRMPRTWDDAALAGGMPDPRTDRRTSPNGWGWVNWRLWENACAIHGVDMGTAAHESARVSMMCGVPGSTFRAPAMHAVIANFLAERFAETRPLASVVIGDAAVPASVDLPSRAAPASVATLGSLASTLSDRPDRPWAGLRARPAASIPAFDGSPGSLGPLGAMDAHALTRTRRLRGTTNAATDRLYEQLHDGYRDFSALLARDVVAELERTVAVEHVSTPYWIPSSWGPFGVDIGGGIQSDSGVTWDDRLSLALKLLKSGVATSISVALPGMNGFYFDTHGAGGHERHAPMQRATFEVASRFLAELKLTPIGDGRSLLDDTVVMITSELGRTWPRSGACDHWPANGVVLAGGCLTPNTMHGGYDLSGPDDALGFLGRPVEMLAEGGGRATAVPRTADVCRTVYRLFGVPDAQSFIPGGSGEVVGVQRA